MPTANWQWISIGKNSCKCTEWDIYLEDRTVIDTYSQTETFRVVRRHDLCNTVPKLRVTRWQSHTYKRTKNLTRFTPYYAQSPETVTDIHLVKSLPHSPHHHVIGHRKFRKRTILYKLWNLCLGTSFFKIMLMKRMIWQFWNHKLCNLKIKTEKQICIKNKFTERRSTNRRGIMYSTKTLF